MKERKEEGKKKTRTEQLSGLMFIFVSLATFPSDCLDSLQQCLYRLDSFYIFIKIKKKKKKKKTFE